MAIKGARPRGSLQGGMLTEAGEDVMLINKSADHVDFIKSKGFQISGVRNDRIIKAKEVTEPKTVGQVDLIFLWPNSLTQKKVLRISASLGYLAYFACRKPKCIA